MPWACVVRSSRRVGPLRRGAGSMPAAVRISQTVVEPTGCPSRISSPWIRRQPQRGFSWAGRTTSVFTAPAVDGLPGRARSLLESHLLAINLRCHPSNVPGVTGNTCAHRHRGIREDSAANHSRSAGSYRTGPESCLRSTAFSCRRTSSSASLAASRRSSNAGTASSFRASWYARETITRTGFQQAVGARQTHYEQQR